MMQGVSNMTDLNFTINILVLVKEHFEEFDKSMYWLDKMKQYIDSPYRRAFWQGAYDYVCFVCGHPYTVKKELRLPEMTYTPGYAMSGATPEQLDHAWAHAMPTWYAYNIVTEGCNSVC